MQTFADIVKSTLVPGSMFFLLLGVAFGVFLLFCGPRAARRGRQWLGLLLATYFILAIPVVSNALISMLQVETARLDQPADARGARVVVVIGAGVVSYEADGRAIHELGRRTAFTVLEAARIFQLIGGSWLVTSGGIPDPVTQTLPESEVMRDELVRLGVPAARILLDSESRNTAEQVANVARLLRDKQLTGPIVAVMTPAHSRRVMLLAARQKLDVVPSVAADLRYDRGQEGWRRWRPSLEALRGSESAMYELLAIVYTWLR
jgi:uncharacterized SAM-binding protein YcdF (DUF218 family)